MNRNNEAHFNRIPETHISRSRFKRDQNVKMTFDAGKLIPFYVDEVLPGDTFSVDTTGLVRMTTPIFPVMDNCYLDLYYFFVPNRIVWDDWKEFMGENETTAWISNKPKPEVPQIFNSGLKYKAFNESSSAMANGPAEESVLDYMGIPTKINRSNKTTTSDILNTELSFNALPIRGYCTIWNEWFRDQNLTDPIYIPKNGTDTRTPVYGNYSIYKHIEPNGSFTRTEMNQNAVCGGELLPVAKFHDYFTSALPAPQKGAAVNIALSGNSPVYLAENNGTKLDSNYFLYLNGTSGTNPVLPGFTKPVLYNGTFDATHPLVTVNGTTTDAGTTQAQKYLFADLSNVTATTINELRQAFAVQHYYEALARGGSRYREIIQSMFGTTISDKTVQIPEYLGGGRYMINMSQVVQTSETTDKSPQGNTAAISVTPFSENSFTKSFEEHGFVIGVMCVRHDRTYQQGIERFWSRKDTLDYYFPQFANLGEQAIKRKEIFVNEYLTLANEEETFGYQEAWAEYRMKPNRVAGKFRSNAEGTLDAWHYADNYEETPYLSDEWIREGKSEIQRTLAVQDEPQFIADIMIKNNTTRPMPLYSVPGLEKL